MTIDEMVSEVAKIKGSAPTVKTDAKPVGKPAEAVKTAPITKTAPQITEKPSLSLQLAKEIAYCIEKAAQQIGINAVIAIVNESGRPILLEAMDNSLIASIGAAQDKAYTAVALKMPTHKALEESRGGAFDGLTNGNGILMLGGGCPITLGDAVIGGIGVSGGTKEQDILLSSSGIMYFNKRIKIQ